MPVHDWTRVDEGTFLDFRHGWLCAIRGALNRGGLPAGCYAQIAQRSVFVRSEKNHRTVGLIEIVAPIHKASSHAVRSFIDRLVGLLEAGVSVLIVDLLPPTPADPHGIHGVIWQRIDATHAWTPPTDRPLTLVSYEAAPIKTAYVEPIAVGSVLPAMPLFLEPDLYVSVPLEPTYLEAWEGMPWMFREELGEPS